MINVLDKSIYNLIAAGEVVERPASVVKELVENSIDAGATEISIDISEGGKRLIKVVDNGSGILRDDIVKAFLPHATSKITTAADLDAIGTLGFRGEALSSIAAVGRVTVTSKTAGTVFGSTATVDAGAIGEVADMGFKDGTSIVVEDLFYNVPARAKFLKSNRSEGMEITALISRLILANPHISFKYSNEDGVVLFSGGTGLKDAVLAVYGRKTVENLIIVESTISDIVVGGFVGKPEISRPTRSGQTLIINGRYVVNSTVSKAALDAYGTYLMKGQFPFFVLRLDIPLERVDVNVHPNKLDVRFSDGNLIYKLVRESVSRALSGYRSIPTIDFCAITQEDREQFSRQLGDSQCIPIYDNYAQEKVLQPVYSPSAESNPNEGDALTGSILTQTNASENPNSWVESLSRVHAETTNPPQQANYNPATLSTRTLPNLESRESTQTYTNRASINLESSNTHTYNTRMIPNLESEDLNSYSRVSSFISEGGTFGEGLITNVGSIFNTYLILQGDDIVYFVDQHAAHERLLFDRFMSKVNANNICVQHLLVPYVFEISVSDYDIFTENLQTLNEFGFCIEPLSARAFKISAVPAQLSGINLHKFVDLLTKEKHINSANLGDIIKDRIARNACRSAIKGGDVLSEQDAIELIKQFNNSVNLRCPHGRPIVLKVTKKEIEKWFKRIV